MTADSVGFTIGAVRMVFMRRHRPIGAIAIGRNIFAGHSDGFGQRLLHASSVHRWLWESHGTLKNTTLEASSASPDTMSTVRSGASPSDRAALPAPAAVLPPPNFALAG